jgi:hypothetical protein
MIVTETTRAQARKARLREIEAELSKLKKQRQKLIKERSYLMMREYGGNAQFWADIIFELIKNHPGISREGILVELDAHTYISPNVLTNTLTTLRRRGEIENHGTRKCPRWHIKDIS